MKAIIQGEGETQKVDVVLSNDSFDGFQHVTIYIDDSQEVDVDLDDLLAAVEAFKEQRKLDDENQDRLKS